MEVAQINKMMSDARAQMQTAYTNFGGIKGMQIQDLLLKLQAIDEKLDFKIVIETSPYVDGGVTAFYWDISINGFALEDVDSPNAVYELIEDNIMPLEDIEGVEPLLEKIRLHLFDFEELEAPGSNSTITITTEGADVQIEAQINGRTIEG